MGARRNRVIIAAMLAALATGQLAAQPLSSAAPHETMATWINPSGSVKVATGDCGGKLCGWVVWASSEAQNDARDAGTARLIGTELLQNYRQVSADEWTGHVFVPDRGSSYYSTITRLDTDRLKISGCILGGLICKSQVWRKA